MFVRTQPFEEGALALLDMGSAVKDLALSGIFPGDMLLKNFGVTRSGRVVFYDYDELALLSSINFRWLPVPIHPEDELSSDPWWGVGDGDVFPEELPAFLGVPPRLREHFMATHADLYDPGTWRSIQNRLAAGEIIEIPRTPRSAVSGDAAHRSMSSRGMYAIWSPTSRARCLASATATKT